MVGSKKPAQLPTQGASTAPRSIGLVLSLQHKKSTHDTAQLRQPHELLKNIVGECE